MSINCYFEAWFVWYSFSCYFILHVFVFSSPIFITDYKCVSQRIVCCFSFRFLHVSLSCAALAYNYWFILFLLRAMISKECLLHSNNHRNPLRWAVLVCLWLQKGRIYSWNTFSLPLRVRKLHICSLGKPPHRFFFLLKMLFVSESLKLLFSK